VIDGGLAGFDVEGGGFEEDVGLGSFQPSMYVGKLQIRFDRFVGQECPSHTINFQAVRVGDPS
jgi:hypothetical protein